MALSVVLLACTPAQQEISASHPADSKDGAAQVATDSPAAWPSDTGAYGTCMDQAVTNPDFALCGGAELERQEAALDTVWRLVLQDAAGFAEESSYPELIQALLDEHEAWVAYREKACRYFSHSRGRYGVVIHLPSCLISIVAARIEYLRGWSDP